MCIISYHWLHLNHQHTNAKQKILKNPFISYSQESVFQTNIECAHNESQWYDHAPIIHNDRPSDYDCGVCAARIGQTILSQWRTSPKFVCKLEVDAKEMKRFSLINTFRTFPVSIGFDRLMSFHTNVYVFDVFTQNHYMCQIHDQNLKLCDFSNRI